MVCWIQSQCVWLWERFASAVCPEEDFMNSELARATQHLLIYCPLDTVIGQYSTNFT